MGRATKRRRPRAQRDEPQRGEPLNVYLTVRFRFGPQPEDAVTMLDQRRIPMVDSVFKARRRIARAFTGLMVKAALVQPKVLAEIAPALRLLTGLRIPRPPGEQ